MAGVTEHPSDVVKESGDHHLFVGAGSLRASRYLKSMGEFAYLSAVAYLIKR
jgi:hypothetical protein